MYICNSLELQGRKLSYLKGIKTNYRGTPGSIVRTRSSSFYQHTQLNTHRDSLSRSDLSAATAEVVQAFRTAKNAARLTNSGVTNEIKLARDESKYIIAFAFDAKQCQDGEVNISQNGLELVDIELPKKISVSASFTSQSEETS